MQLRETLLSALKKINIDIELIDNTTDLRKNIGMDSQELIELFYVLSKEYGVCLPSDSIAKVNSFEDLIHLANQYAHFEKHGEQVGIRGQLCN